jgi:hypothetical protein
MPQTRAALEANHQQSLDPDFGLWMAGELRTNLVSVLRLHASGEFYNADYVQKWIYIADRRPTVRIYGYTRAWRDEHMLRLLHNFVSRRNVRFWYSCDAETGPPPVDRYVRVAYMQTHDDERPAFNVDLVFRTTRKTVLKRTSYGRLVCPPENGVTATTCEKCRLCFSDRPIPRFSEPFNAPARRPHPKASGVLSSLQRQL